MPAVIGGMVYTDLNNNGVVDPTEQGIGNTIIDLKDATGNVINTTTTDAAGVYKFTQRDPASIVPTTFEAQAIFAEAPTNQARSASLQQFDPSWGTLTSIELIAEGSISTQAKIENLDATSATVEAKLEGQMGFQLPGAGSGIVAQIQKDQTASLGSYDGNPDYGGTSGKDFGSVKTDAAFQTVTLTSAADLAAYTGTGTIQVNEVAQAKACACGTGNLQAMINTTAQGRVRVVYHYTPSTDLAPGQYTVVERNQPPGMVDGLETRDNMAPITGTERSDFIQVTIVNKTDTSTSNNFGELPAAAISGTVYNDVDRNNTLNQGDPPIPGTTINLSGTDVFGNLVSQSTQSNSGGTYSFGNLPPGSYTLTEIQPGGYSQGANSLGNLGGQINGDTMTLNLPAGSLASPYNFGEVLAAPLPLGDPFNPTPTPTPTPTPQPQPPALPPDPIQSTGGGSKADLLGGSWSMWSW